MEINRDWGATPAGTGVPPAGTAGATPAGTGVPPADGGAQDPLGEAFFEARRRELAERVSDRRYRHVMGVTETCADLACTYGVDVAKARLAGLLHDWDKGYDDAGICARSREVGLEADPFVVEAMPRVLHGMTAARALGREFPEIPCDVLQAIERHTIAARDMAPLDMVLYVADAIEPTRTAERVWELRDEAGRVPLKTLFFDVYRHWLILMIERGCTLHPSTIDIWNECAVRRAAGKAKASGAQETTTEKRDARKPCAEKKGSPKE